MISDTYTFKSIIGYNSEIIQALSIEYRESEGLRMWVVSINWNFRTKPFLPKGFANNKKERDLTVKGQLRFVFNTR